MDAPRKLYDKDGHLVPEADLPIVPNLPAPNKYDYTMLSTFLTCRRKYYLRMIRGLVGLKPPTAAEFGRCIHLALDDWFVHSNPATAKAAFVANFTEDPEDDKRTIKVGLKLLELYFEKYEQEPFKILEIEKVFEVPMGQLSVQGDWTLIGRIDKIIEWDKATMVMDHKTTSRLGYEFFNKIKPNMQFDGYIIAARRLGYPKCDSVLLDALLTAKGLCIPAQLSKLTPLARDISSRTTEELDEYVHDIHEIVDDLRDCYMQDRWSRNTESCCDYVECPYRKICKEEPAIREAIIAQDYKIEHWDPMRHVKENA